MVPIYNPVIIVVAKIFGGVCFLLFKIYFHLKYIINTMKISINHLLISKHPKIIQKN
jgi:hypothetical protein